MKNNYFSKQTRNANLCNVWLNRRQLDSQSCFHRQSVAIHCFVEVHEENLVSVFEKMMTSQATLKESWAYSGVPRPPFENGCPRAQLWGGAMVEPNRRWSTQQRSSHFSDYTCCCFCLGYFSSLPTLSPELCFSSSVSTHADVSFLEVTWIVIPLLPTFCWRPSRVDWDPRFLACVPWCLPESPTSLSCLLAVIQLHGPFLSLWTNKIPN